MPTQLHEVLVQLLRDDPVVLAWLLEQAAGLVLEPGTELRTQPAELTDLGPAELRADFVTVLANPKPYLAVVGEVQLARDDAKRRVWPAYSANLWRREGIPVVVLVVTADRAVARWARRPVTVGPRHHFAPLVIGPEEVPRLADAAAPPEVLTLSAIAHAHDDDDALRPVARAAFESLAATPDGDFKGTLYDLLLNVLPGHVTSEWAMQFKGYRFQSWLYKEQAAADFAAQRATLLQQGREQGRAEVLAESHARARRTLVSLLTLKFGAVPPPLRSRVDECHDLSTLETWMTRVLGAATAEAVFTP